MESLDKIPFTDKNPVLVDLVDVATLQNISWDELAEYQRSQKRMWDHNATLMTAKEDGIAEGIEKGREEGIMDVALNMKKLGFDIDIIAKATGLSVEEIEKL